MWCPREGMSARKALVIVLLVTTLLFSGLRYCVEHGISLSPALFGGQDVAQQNAELLAEADANKTRAAFKSSHVRRIVRYNTSTSSLQVSLRGRPYAGECLEVPARSFVGARSVAMDSKGSHAVKKADGELPSVRCSDVDKVRSFSRIVDDRLHINCSSGALYGFTPLGVSLPYKWPTPINATSNRFAVFTKCTNPSTLNKTKVHFLVPQRKVNPSLSLNTEPATPDIRMRVTAAKMPRRWRPTTRKKGSAPNAQTLPQSANKAPAARHLLEIDAFAFNKKVHPLKKVNVVVLHVAGLTRAGLSRALPKLRRYIESYKGVIEFHKARWEAFEFSNVQAGHANFSADIVQLHFPKTSKGMSVSPSDNLFRRFAQGGFDTHFINGYLPNPPLLSDRQSIQIVLNLAKVAHTHSDDVLGTEASRNQRAPSSWYEKTCFLGTHLGARAVDTARGVLRKWTAYSPDHNFMYTLTYTMPTVDGRADDDLDTALLTFVKQVQSTNTIIFLLGGAALDKPPEVVAQQEIWRTLEDRNPAFVILLGRQIVTSSLRSVLQFNADKLVTTIDIHRTIRPWVNDMRGRSYIPDGDFSFGPVNFMQERISGLRTCEDVGLSAAVCNCWTTASRHIRAI